MSNNPQIISFIKNSIFQIFANTICKYGYDSRNVWKHLCRNAIPRVLSKGRKINEPRRREVFHDLTFISFRLSIRIVTRIIIQTVSFIWIFYIAHKRGFNLNIFLFIFFETWIIYLCIEIKLRNKYTLASSIEFLRNNDLFVRQILNKTRVNITSK